MNKKIIHTLKPISARILNCLLFQISSFVNDFGPYKKTGKNHQPHSSRNVAEQTYSYKQSATTGMLQKQPNQTSVCNTSFVKTPYWRWHKRLQKHIVSLQQLQVTNSNRLGLHRLRWFRHVQRMEENRIPRKVIYSAFGKSLCT
jgi:hypothetical protein